MLIPLHDLVRKYNIHLSGVLHVGAHECEEIRDYEQYVSRDKVLWVEAMPDKVITSRNTYPGVQMVCAVVSDCVEEVTFHQSNNGQSSSILNLGTHQQLHPQVWYVKDTKVQTCTLATVLRSQNNAFWSDPMKSNPPLGSDPTSHGFNFINLDIQGAELKALRGMEAWLSDIDYIYTEVNQEYVYEGCALIGEIDEYLAKFGFRRVETVWHANAWGDAFYIRV
jgi:hypothetical protein